MKFIVDKLPSRRSECPFLSYGDLCKISGITCPHFVDDDGCDHLLPVEKSGPVLTLNMGPAVVKSAVAEAYQRDMRRRRR